MNMCTAIQKLYLEYSIEGFLVTSLTGNPSLLASFPVMELTSFASSLTEVERLERHILIATPEDVHAEIVECLEQHGFYSYTCMDSCKEARLMEQYFALNQDFPVLHNLPTGEGKDVFLQVVQAKFYKDKMLKNVWELPKWIIPLQVGASMTEERVTELVDNQGDNISSKNVNYCELTGLYWLWKNGLADEHTYYGLFHYRRILDITEEDLCRMQANNVDVVLPFPTMHEPDIREHHQRYVKDSDWQAMLQALRELQPEYADAYEEIFSQQYLYNYNMLIAKKQVLADYCAWLFPILERTEELSDPKGWERADRYIGYIGENLLTLYFMYHRKDLNIVHTGRLMLT